MPVERDVEAKENEAAFEAGRPSPSMLRQMKAIGGTWAAYQNRAWDSHGFGHLQFLRVGSGCTFEAPPAQLPDTSHGPGWKYRFIGLVNLTTGLIEAPDANPT